MLRQILPPSSQLELITLDASLRRGDLLWVRQRLRDLLTRASPPALLLRAGVYAYLVNDYPTARAHAASIVETELRAYAHFLSALIAIDLKQFETATSLLTPLAQTWPPNSLEHQIVLLARATLAFYTVQYPEAERLLDTMARNPAQPWVFHEHQRLRGMIAYQRTQYQEAQHLLEKARAGFAILEDHYNIARCDNMLADIFRRQDDRARALQHVTQAIAYFQKQDATVPLARCYNVLGSIQHYFNAYDEALESYQFALHHFQKAGLIINHVWALHNIGLIHRQRGEFKKALRAYAEARSLVSQINRPDVAAYLDRSLAELGGYMGQKAQATQLLEHAADTFLALGMAAHAAGTWRLMASYAYEQGQLEEAQRLLEQSSALFLQAHRPAQAAITSVHLARVVAAQGNNAYAIQLLETSIAILKARHMPHQAAEAWTALAEIYMQQKQWDQAQHAVQEAMTLAPEDFHDHAWQLQALRTQLALQAQDIPQARAALRQATEGLWKQRRAAISPKAAATLAQKAQEVYTLAVDLALQEGDVAAALCALEEHKAIQLFHRLSPPTEKEPHLPPPSQTDPISALTTRLTQLRRAIQIARWDQDWARLTQLEKTFDDLAQQLDALQTSYMHLVKKPELDITALRAALDARHGAGQWGCFVIGHFETEKDTGRLYQFWLDSHNILVSHQTLDAISRHLLHLACQPQPSYRRKLLDWKDEKRVPDLWQRLEGIMLPQTLAAAMAKVQTIYLSASGPLTVFPFFALRVDGAPLALQKHLAIVASLPILQMLLQSRDLTSTALPTPAQAKGLVCAISRYPREDLSDLPHTYHEAVNIFEKLSEQSVLLLDDEATLAAVQQHLHAQGDTPFEVLHFSLHARFNPHRAMLSHLVLYDDNVYVSDILRWRLNAELVTLAACDTGIMHHWPGDEQMGLPQAFLIAGARRVLAALWPIQDKLSAAFLDRFYEHLGETRSVAEALRRTQRHYHRQQSSPFRWGAFTVMGLP